MRLHGRGTVHLPGDARFVELRRHFTNPRRHGERSIIEVEIDRVSDSCGFAVPLLHLEGQRVLLDQWTDRKTPEELDAYHAIRNSTSIDGLGALLRNPQSRS